MKKLLLLSLFLLPLIASAQTDTSECFCVSLARQYSANVPRLNAKYWPLLPQSIRSTPMLGGQILLRYNTLYDVATIAGFGESGFEVIGVSFDDCKPIRRVIPYNDSRIQMFFDF